jgi:hypothetical protein
LNRKGSKEGNPFEEEEWDEYSNTDAPLVVTIKQTLLINLSFTFLKHFKSKTGPW